MTRNKELYLPIALSMALTLVSGLFGWPLGSTDRERVRSSHHAALDEHNMEPV